MTEQVNNWIGNNIKWILTLVVLSVSNYFLLANKIDSNVRGVMENANQISLIKNQEISRLSVEITRLESKDSDKNDIMKEMKFNLKRLMESQGIKYIEDTNKK